MGGNGGGVSCCYFGIVGEGKLPEGAGKRLTKSLAGKEVVVAGDGGEAMELGGGEEDCNLKMGMGIDPVCGGMPGVGKVVGPVIDGRPGGCGGRNVENRVAKEGSSSELCGIAGGAAVELVAGVAGASVLGVVPGKGVLGGRPVVDGLVGIGREIKMNRVKEILLAGGGGVASGGEVADSEFGGDSLMVGNMVVAAEGWWLELGCWPVVEGGRWWKEMALMLPWVLEVCALQVFVELLHVVLHVLVYKGIPAHKVFVEMLQWAALAKQWR